MGPLGFSTCCFPIHQTIRESLSFAMSQGFQAVELEVNEANFEAIRVEHSLLEWVGEIAATGRLRLGVHSPGKVNFSDPRAVKRVKAEILVMDSIRLAAQLGARTIVVHPGRVVGGNGSQKVRESWEQNVSAIRRCAEFARQEGMVVSVENLCHEPNSVNPDIASFMAMCQEIGLDLIGLTLDTNHAALVDGLAESTSVIGPYVDTIHFSSNRGQKSDHCEPGEGVIDFSTISEYLRGFDGTTIIELNETGAESAAALLRTRAYLERLLPSGQGTTPGAIPSGSTWSIREAPTGSST